MMYNGKWEFSDAIGVRLHLLFDSHITISG